MSSADTRQISAGAPTRVTVIPRGGTARNYRSFTACNAQPPSASARASSRRPSAIVEAEYASDLALDDIARRVASSPPPAAARLRRDRHTTFRDAPDGGADGARRRAARARGLTVREVAHRVGYRQPAQFAKAFRRHHGAAPSAYRRRGPLRRRSATARASPRSPPERRSSRGRRGAGCVPRCALSPERPIGCARSMPEEQHGPRRGAPKRTPSSRWSSSGVDRHRRSASRSALAIHWFPPPARRRRTRSTRSGTSCIIVSVPIFVLVDGRRAASSVIEVPHAAGRGERSTARRSTATRGSRSSGPRSRRSSSSASCTYAYVVLHDIEKAPAAGNAAGRRRDRPAVRLDASSTTARAARSSRPPSSTCPRASR